MLHSYTQIFIDAFYRIPMVTIVFLLIFSTCIIIISLIMGIIALDRFYRPNVPQYPYNIILDRIIPLILLLSPTSFIFFLTKDIETISYTQRFCFILISHIVFLIPLFYYWSNLRSWKTPDTLEPGQSYITLNHPIIYQHISIALLYPAIWGIYFTLNRYLRLGVTIDLSNYISNFNYDIVFLLLFLLPFYSIWIKIAFWKMLSFRFWLWSEVSKLLYVMHLYFLRFKIYFYIFEKLYKLAFICGTYVSLNPYVYPNKKKYPKFRYWLRALYYKPYIVILFIFICVMFEIIITKGNIHYTLYLLFIYPILYFLQYSSSYLFTMPFINDVCRADYFACNWENPRYPAEFWVFFKDPSERYNFNWNFSQQEKKYISNLAAKYNSKKYSYIPMLPIRIQSKSFCMRLKGTYKAYNGVRWVHTPVVRSYHPLTAWFARKFEERIVLLRSNWSHYNPIANAEKNGYLTSNLKDNSSYKNFSGNSYSFKQAVEYNLQTNYLHWIKNSVKLSEYRGQQLNTKNQPEPDMVADFSNSNFHDKRIHGLDQKSGKADMGISSIYSTMENKTYLKKLKHFQAQLFHHCDSTTLDVFAITKAFHTLGNTCNDLKAHQLVWANNVHLFTDKFIPPMRVPDHFSLEDATPEFVLLIKKAEIKVTQISNFLYAKRVPDNLNRPPEDLFYDSELQKMLEQN